MVRGDIGEGGGRWGRRRGGGGRVKGLLKQQIRYRKIIFVKQKY